MTTKDREVNKLAVSMAAASVLTDDDKDRVFRKLKRASKKGNGSAPAMNYCNPVRDYDFYSVDDVVRAIETNVVLLEDFAAALHSLTNKVSGRYKVQNVMSVLDINVTDVGEETLEFLKTYYLAYQDRLESLGEHLLDICSAAESDALSKSPNKDVRREIKELGKLASAYDAAYIRFIKV